MTYFAQQPGWFTLACFITAVLLVVGFVVLGYPARIARTYGVRVPESGLRHRRKRLESFVERLGGSGLELYRKQLRCDTLFAALLSISLLAILDAWWANGVEGHPLLKSLRILVFVPLVTFASDLLEDVLLLRSVSAASKAGLHDEKDGKDTRGSSPHVGTGLLIGGQVATGVKFTSLGASLVLLLTGGGLRIADAATTGPRPGPGDGGPPPRPVVAKIDFRMADRTVDPDGNHVFAYLPPTEIQASTFDVTLIGCASGAAASSFAWTLEGEDGTTRDMVASHCETHVRLDEGKYEVSLIVTFDDGQAAATQDTIDVEDWLIVSMGDSYASGEGAPEAGLGTSKTSRWKDPFCHRSSLAGAPQAALALERGDTRSSVTIVHVACTGATIEKGLTFPQDATKGGGKLEAQIHQVEALVGDRTPDALLVSIGGNDIGFAPLIKRCLRLLHHCGGREDTEAVTRSIARFAEAGGPTGGIPGLFRCLTTSGCRPGLPGLGVSPNIIFAMTYPDLTKRGGTNGTTCRYLSMTAEELGWAQRKVLGPLDDAIKQAWSVRQANVIDVNSPGWHEHGICADEPWFRTPGRAILHGSGLLGSFHPNDAGYRQGYAPAIVSALRAAGVALGSPE